MTANEGARADARKRAAEPTDLARVRRSVNPEAYWRDRAETAERERDEALRQRAVWFAENSSAQAALGRLREGIEAFVDECASSGCIHLNDLFGRLRALLAAHPGRDMAPDSEGQAGEREERMAALSDEAIRVAEDVWTEDEPTLAEYELTERILAAALPTTDALAEVERRIEVLRPDAAMASPISYRAGRDDALRIVREVRAAADAPATEVGAS